MGYVVKNISEQNRRIQSETGHMIHLGPGASTAVEREPKADPRFFEVNEQKQTKKQPKEDDE